jgi:hypothetical protein
MIVGALGEHGGTNMSTSQSMNALDGNLSAAIAAQGPPPVRPLDAASVNRGLAHLRLAFGAEGFSGAMIYSQNCYDALSHAFSWARLDQCGAFDMLAARSIAEADAPGNEESYFEGETAAGRYLAAATGAGEDSGQADQRLAEIQARARRGRAVGAAPPLADVEANLATAADPSGDNEIGMTRDE